jgi:hypothetical protein
VGQTAVVSIAEQNRGVAAVDIIDDRRGKGRRAEKRETKGGGDQRLYELIHNQNSLRRGEIKTNVTIIVTISLFKRWSKKSLEKNSRA